MKDNRDTTPEARDGRERAQGHIVRFRLTDPDYRTLVELARYHGTTIATLINGALPLIIEKYRVLRALQVPPDARMAWRRSPARRF